MKRERLILVMAAYACAWFLLTRLPGDILLSPIAGSDLSSYYTAGHLVRTGASADLYAVGPEDTILGDATEGPYRHAGEALGIRRQHYYIYPPFFALLTAPLSLLSFPAARLAWLAADLALLGLFVAMYASWRRSDGIAPGLLEAGLIAVTIGLEFLPIIWALAIGQTSLLLLCLIAGCLLLAKRGRDGAAGILLGLATAIKLTPALLVVYFAARGRARLAAVAAAWFVAFNLAAVAALGGAVNLEFYARIVPMMSGGTSYFLNQSLAGFFDRLLTSGDVRQVALEQSLAPKILAMLVSLAMIALTAAAMRRSRWESTLRRPEGLGLDLEVSAVLLLSLMISPISWSHHYTLALVPLYTVVAAAARSGRKSLPLALAIGGAFLLIARKPHVDLFLEGPMRLGLSASLYGAIALWVACLVLLRWGPEGPIAGRRKTEVPLAA